MGRRIRWVMTASAAAMLLLFLLPLVMASPIERPETAAQERGAAEPETVRKTAVGTETLCLLNGGAVEELSLEEYIVGVLRAEMPASFENEALKAQAVAARTYTRYKMSTGGNHGETAQICTDPACCQAYLSAEAAQANWGENAAAYEAKIRQAVESTAGEVMIYNGAPILAAFHSSSSGVTRGAGEVWQNDLPYLQPVSSPEAADAVPNYYSRVSFSAQELREKLSAGCREADFSGAVSGWLKDPVTDEGGNVKTLTVGGVTVRGSYLRSLLGLRSACFTWESDGDGLTFFVTGYGHGVGMSQYGAEQMAQQGADYREILLHYYTGVSVENGA